MMHLKRRTSIVENLEWITDKDNFITWMQQMTNGNKRNRAVKGRRYRWRAFNKIGRWTTIISVSGRSGLVWRLNWPLPHVCAEQGSTGHSAASTLTMRTCDNGNQQACCATQRPWEHNSTPSGGSSSEDQGRGLYFVKLTPTEPVRKTRTSAPPLLTFK